MDDTIYLHGIGTSEGFSFGGKVDNFDVDFVLGSASFDITSPDGKMTRLVFEYEEFEKFVVQVQFALQDLDINSKVKNIKE